MQLSFTGPTGGVNNTIDHKPATIAVLITIQKALHIRHLSSNN